MILSETYEQSFLGCLIRSPELIDKVSHLATNDYFVSLKSKKLFEIIRDWGSTCRDKCNLTETEFLAFTESQYSTWYKTNKPFVSECFKKIVDKDIAFEKWPVYFDGLEKFVVYRLFKDALYEMDQKADQNPLNIGSTIQSGLNKVSTLSTSLREFQKETLLKDTLDEFKVEFGKRLDPNFSPSFFGLKDVDNMMGGFFPGTYNLITARSSVGKSAFINTIIRNMVYKQNKKIIVYNIESGNFSFFMRWFSKDLKIDSKLIKEPKLLTEKQRTEIFDAIEKLYKGYGDKIFPIHKIYYVDQIIQSIEQIRNTYGVDGIFIDLLEYVKARHSTENRTKEIAYISNEFFSMTRDADFFITMIQQQNKEGDRKGEQGSGRNSEDPYMQCDSAMGLYFSENELGERDPRKRILKVMKSRDGTTGSIPINFVGEYTLFEDAAQTGNLTKEDFEED